MRSRVAAALAAFLTWPLSGAAETTLLHCGKLLDVRAGVLRSQSTVAVEGGKIASVAPGFGSAGDARVIDLSGHTCLPGLMDMHVHLDRQYSARSDIENFRLNAADYAISAVRNAEITLLAGFTTVRELGSRFKVSLSLRDAVNRGTVPGPRIFAAGRPIASKGGHADWSNGMRDDLAAALADYTVNGEESARRAVRQRYQDGADLIKITATGGVLSVARSGHAPQFTEAEIGTIVATARDYGMHVAAHAHGAEGIKRAVRAGVHSIDHGTLIDDEGRKLMKQRGTWLVPTIIAGKFVAEQAKLEGFFPELVRPKAAAIGPQTQEAFAKSYKAGVKIAFGTDTGVSAHGDNAKEFAYMVEAGMPPLAAIRSATLATAELLGVSDRLGALEPGKLADVIAVPGDPLADVGVLQRVSFVMKEGAVYKGP